MSLTPDGQTLLYCGIGAENRRQLFVVPLSGSIESRKRIRLHDAAGAEVSGSISPDGHWVAYESNESGSREVYVQPFPGPGPRTRISTEGGLTPRWSRDGQELYYWANNPTSRMTVVDMPRGATLKPGTPRELFHVLSGTTWDVTPDRDRFLVELSASTSGSTIAIVTDWFEELRRRAPVKK